MNPAPRGVTFRSNSCTSPTGQPLAIQIPLPADAGPVSSQRTLKNGKKAFDPALGPHGVGFLIYSADGHMCAELMNPDRPAWKNNVKPTDEEKVSAFDGFFAYCGDTRSTPRSTFSCTYQKFQ